MPSDWSDGAAPHSVRQRCDWFPATPDMSWAWLVSGSVSAGRSRSRVQTCESLLVIDDDARTRGRRRCCCARPRCRGLERCGIGGAPKRREARRPRFCQTECGAGQRASAVDRDPNQDRGVVMTA